MGVMILTVLHYGLCMVLILIVLLQAGKGGGLAAAFGGGSSETIFGVRRGNILTRITAIGVGMFMITSLLLTIILPKQVSVIQKKGMVTEDQMRDVKRPQVPGFPAGAPPAEQESPGAPPTPETPKTEGEIPSTPIPPQPQAQPSIPHETPLTQPLQKVPPQHKPEERASKPGLKESIPLTPASPKTGE